jgi:hypothetical protein
MDPGATNQFHQNIGAANTKKMLDFTFSWLFLLPCEDVKLS